MGRNFLTKWVDINISRTTLLCAVSMKSPLFCS